MSDETLKDELRVLICEITELEELGDDRRVGGFLQHDDVGAAGADDVAKRLLAPFAAVANVVTQDSEDHSSLSISTR